MNLEEAIKYARKEAEEMATKSVELFPSCEGRKYLDCAEEHYQFADWLEELKELRKYKEKYKWHDLRKNPADLPKDGKHVLADIKGGCVNRTWHDSCGWRNATAKKARYYSNDRVIAWKEIEEFENEEI